VLLDDDEIEAAKVESRKTLDLVQFVDAGEIDVFYFEKPYYVVPPTTSPKRRSSCCARR
jgi:DNA end-binding protein Ku